MALGLRYHSLDVCLSFAPVTVTMSRGSCPDLDKLMNESNNHSESWLSAFNKVVKNRENASKTVSLGVVHTRPGIESIFGGNTNPVSDGIIALTHQSRSIICNGHNILALSREDIVNMSLSDAHETLFQLRAEGNLMKKGFKRLRMWKLRYFILSGKILSYWEVGVAIWFPCRWGITTSFVTKPRSHRIVLFQWKACLDDPFRLPFYLVKRTVFTSLTP